MTTPQIEPIIIKLNTVKQSKYETVGKYPLEVFWGPSGSGKTVLLQNILLDLI